MICPVCNGRKKHGWLPPGGGVSQIPCRHCNRSGKIPEPDDIDEGDIWLCIDPDVAQGDGEMKVPCRYCAEKFWVWNQYICQWTEVKDAKPLYRLTKVGE